MKRRNTSGGIYATDEGQMWSTNWKKIWGSNEGRSRPDLQEKMSQEMMSQGVVYIGQIWG